MTKTRKVVWRRKKLRDIFRIESKESIESIEIIESKEAKESIEENRNNRNDRIESIEKRARMKCENLEVWKRACRVSVEIYKIFKDLKDYGFKDQITRNSLSIPSNVAEGVERFSNQETVRFLDIARASCAELITQIYIAIEIGYIQKGDGLKLKNEIEDISKMITSLIKKYKNF